MSEQFETIAVPLVGKLDTKSAAAAISPENLALLENGDYGDVGLVKRSGYTGLAAPYNALNAFFNNEVGVPKLLFGYDDQLVLLTSNRLFTKTANGWLDHGFFVNLHHEVSDITTTGTNQHQMAVASTGVITGYIWNTADNASGSIVCTVVDEETKACYATNTTIQSGNGIHPNATRIGDVILFTWIDTSSNNLEGLVVNPTSVVASLAATPLTIRSDIDGTLLSYAICSGSVDAILLWASDDSVFAGGGICHVTAAGSVTYATQVTSSDYDLTSVAYNSRDGLVKIYCRVSGGSVTHKRIYNESDLTFVSASTPSTANIVRLAIAPVMNSAVSPKASFVTAYEVSTGTSDTNTVTTEIDLGTGWDALHHASLAAAGHVLDETGHPWFFVSHASRTGLQNNYYLIGPLLQMIVGPILAGTALGVPTVKVLANVGRIDSTHYVAGLASYRRLQMDPATDTFQGAHKAAKRLDFFPKRSPQAVQLGRSAYVTGSSLWHYDGTTVYEAGFHMFPDMKSADFVPAYDASYSLTAGSYSYRIYYESYTASGERVRSAALTIPVSLTNQGRVAITIPTLSFTCRGLNYSTETVKKPIVSIVVYRTKVNDLSGIYYRVSSADSGVGGNNGFLTNDSSVDTVAFTDNMSDTTAATKEIDYQSEGKLENISPPPPGVITVYKNRLILAGGEIPRGQIRFSKERLADESVQFADALTLTAGTLGPVKGLAVVNETPIVFEEEKAHVIVGSGLDNAGQGTGWDIQNISVDTGCNENRSIVRYPGGLLFKSDKGIYQMGTDYVVRYIGAEVEQYNGNDVVAAHLVPESNRVIFQSSAGRALVYDYYYDKWGTYTNHYALAAAGFAEDQYAWLRSDYSTMIRNPGVYTDGGSPYPLKFKTGKFRLQNLQDYMKLTRIGFLGEYFSPHRLRVGIFRDRDVGPYETFEWAPDDVLEQQTWGGGSLWGGDEVWGGSSGSSDYRFMHRPKLSKYEEIALMFEDIPTGDPGQAYSMTEIIFEVAKLPGQGRISVQRKV